MKANAAGGNPTHSSAAINTVEFALGTDTVLAVGEYTTVEALAGNAAVYARLPERWSVAVDGTDAAE